MTDIKIEIVFNHFPQLTEELIRQADAVCEEMAGRALRGAQEAIRNPPKTGRVYRYGKVEHQASAPGEAPATDTGALAANAKTEQAAPAMWEILFFQDYAAALEFGTPKMLPRPYLRPAVEAVRDRFVKGMKALGFSE